MLYAQFVQISSFGSSPVQWLRRSSHEAWSGFHGSSPRFGRPRCHDWSAQWLPSGIVQPVTNQARGGPAYLRQTLTNPRESVLRYVPQPPE